MIILEVEKSNIDTNRSIGQYIVDSVKSRGCFLYIIIPWAIRISVIFLLVWWYGTYSLFSPYFPGEPYPLREYARVMLILLCLHMPVLWATFPSAKKYRWLILIPIVGMICLYVFVLRDCPLGICVHLLALYLLFGKGKLIKGVQHEKSV